MNSSILYGFIVAAIGAYATVNYSTSTTQTFIGAALTGYISNKAANQDEKNCRWSAFLAAMASRFGFNVVANLDTSGVVGIILGSMALPLFASQ